MERFFETNPDEELNYPIVLTKFGCSDNAARCAVKALVKKGLIESVHVIRTRAKGQGK